MVLQKGVEKNAAFVQQMVSLCIARKLFAGVTSPIFLCDVTNLLTHKKTFTIFGSFHFFMMKKNHLRGSCYFGHSYPLSNDATLPTVFFIYFVGADQQPGFIISGTSTANSQNVHKISKLIMTEIHPNNIVLPGRKTKYNYFSF